MDSPRGFVNHGMDYPDESEGKNVHLTTLNSADDTDTGLDQLSPDSEYGNLM